jgi:hypothetical protein
MGDHVHPLVSVKGGGGYGPGVLSRWAPRLGPGSAPGDFADSLAVAPLCDALGMLGMETLRPILRAAWGPDTCYPNVSQEWGSDNPARAQCGMTALVVQDLLGGDLVLGEVHVDGAKFGNHYWNRLPDGTEVDLTADQFLPGEVVINGLLAVAEGPRQ